MAPAPTRGFTPSAHNRHKQQKSSWIKISKAMSLSNESQRKQNTLTRNPCNRRLSRKVIYQLQLNTNQHVMHLVSQKIVITNR